MQERKPGSLYKREPKQLEISTELKAIFALENRLMKRIRPNGNKTHDWYRERMIFHIDAFNCYARLCDRNKRQCHLSDMNFATLAETSNTVYLNVITSYAQDAVVVLTNSMT